MPWDCDITICRDGETYYASSDGTLTLAELLAVLAELVEQLEGED